MHFPSSTLIFGVFVALVGTSTHLGAYGRPSDNSKTLNSIDPATLKLINDNGLVTLLPDFNIAKPDNTHHSNSTSIGDINSGDEKITFYDASDNIIREAEVSHSSVLKRIEQIKFTDHEISQSDNGKALKTALVKVDYTIRNKVEKLDITLFDGRKEAVEFDYSTFRNNLEKITVRRLWNKDDYTELKVDHDIFNNIEKINVEQKSVSQF
ncbi:hypothetical protein BDF19DRAFT_409987 [Syncephalis fuscata]|nr:hypothetical protein BDF19DRAFT_409987 [Syncephalis fuscata]